MAGTAGNTMKGGAKKSWDVHATSTKDGLKVARLTGKNGTIFVPLDAAEAGRGTVRVRAWTDHAGSFSVKVNGGKDVNGKLVEGWQTVDIAIPSGQLHEGENSLQWFMHNSGVEFAWLQIGAQTPAGDDGSAAKFYDPAQKALILPKDGAMAWYLDIPQGAKLAGDLADGSCAVAVKATGEDGKSVEGTLKGLGGAVDLSALAGKAAKVELDGSGCAVAALTNANLVAGGAMPALKRGDAPKYVLFVIMDSLRADRVRPFNPKARPETPNWDKLAGESTIFLNHYVQGNESQVSHASMWSSNYLVKHKAADMPDKLADKWVTIDEVAKKAGKTTFGVSANGYIRPSRGFGSSWSAFTNHIEKDMGLRGADVMGDAFGMIDKKHDQPWFVYMGLIDTHVTWRAKQPWLDKYDGGYKGKFATEFGDDGPGGVPKNLTDKEKDHVRALYDSNVSYQDDLLGKMVDKLKAWGVYDQTMIIVTADHGDEQWEEGDRVGHGGSERETLLHVPLMIHYPPMFPAGAKVKEGTEGIDIVPTLADALGVAADGEWQGASLIPVANGQGGYLTMSTSSKYENAHAGRIDHWKAIISAADPKVYDLAKDPGEKHDLGGDAKADIGARMVMDPMWILRQWNVEWKKSQWGNASNVTAKFAADLGE